jgi:hypothetical protein
VGVEDLADVLGGAAWYCALLDDDLVGCGYFCDVSCGGFDVGEVGCAACAETFCFCGSVDGDEDEVGFVDGRGDVGGEVKVGDAAVGAISGNFNDVVETGLVDGEGFGLPCCNAGFAEVDDGDFDVGILFGDDGAGWTALGGGVIVSAMGIFRPGGSNVIHSRRSRLLYSK